MIRNVAREGFGLKADEALELGVTGGRISEFPNRVIIPAMPNMTRRSALIATLPMALQAQYQPKQSDRPEPFEGDEAGFRPIFNGRDLEGWEGDPKYWRVADGNLTGEVTPETLLKSNTFIIWRGGSPADFELKAELPDHVGRETAGSTTEA